MDRFIPNVPGCSKYHISKNGKLYSIFSGTWKVVKPVIRSDGYVLMVIRLNSIDIG